MKISSNSIIINIDSTILSKEECKLLENEIIGGVILFDHNYENVEQTISLIDSIKSINNNILIAVDHEGGRVQRFREEFTLLPSFESIGKIYLDDQDLADEIAYYCGYISGFELKRAGIDINFSPVVDLSSESNVLNSRTFSRNPEAIFRLASRYIMGHIDNGIMPVLKHFPGHGAVLSDTHTTISECNFDYDELSPHVEPFKELYKKFKIPIMTSHITYRKISPEPVTVSSKWLSELSKTIFDQKPIFISDDLEMSAISKNFENESKVDILNKTFNAGCNLAIITTMQNKQIIKCKESYYYFQKEYIDQSNNIDKTIAEDINLLCFKDKSFYEDNSKNYHNALEGLKSQIEKK